MQNLTDDQLMTAVKNDSFDELGVLFQRYQKPIYNYFIKATGQTMLSEDLLQEVFFKIMSARKTYLGQSNFRAWIYTIARNVYRDHLRKDKMHVPLDEIEASMTDHRQADDDLLWNEEQRLIHRSLQRLPEKMRQVLILSRFQQLKYEEIGHIMDLSVSAVKVTVFRGLRELKAVYRQMAGELA